MTALPAVKLPLPCPRCVVAAPHLGVEAVVIATAAETPPVVLAQLALPAPIGTFNAHWLLEKLAGPAEPRSRTGATAGVLIAAAAAPLLRTAGRGT